MNTHTPGPWVMHDGAAITVTAKIDRTTVTVAKAVYGYGDDMRANARLIAASPELLEALKAALPVLMDIGALDGATSFADMDHAIELARAAIAKATNA